MLFAKWPTALIGPGEAIVLPPISSRSTTRPSSASSSARGRSDPVENALEAVRGYLCANDVTARDLQLADGQFTRAKSLDTFCPVGELVPAARSPTRRRCGIRCLVNGEVRQDSTTADMIFSVAELIAFVSEAITLEPGDLLLTGTPEGVGVFRDPPVVPRRRRRGDGGDRGVRLADEPGPRLTGAWVTHAAAHVHPCITRPRTPRTRPGRSAAPAPPSRARRGS